MAEAHRRQSAGHGGVLLDVRQPNEWAGGVVPGSQLIFVADLPARVTDLPSGKPVTVFCRTGHRASMAASVLDNAGFDVTLVDQGGAAAWPAPLEPLPPGAGEAPGSADAPSR
jgi:hydroxyacylglutathione hydrolase